jgi:hypothetical protein
MLIAYSFNPETGEYTGSAIKAHLPAHSTTIAPPTPSSGNVVVWNGIAWNELPDNRGDWWHKISGIHVFVANIGDPAPADSVQVNPLIPIDSWNHHWDGAQWVQNGFADTYSGDLIGAKDAKKKLIELQYNVRHSADFIYAPKSATFQVSGSARDRILTGTVYINAGSTSINWTDIDNNVVAFTAAEWRDMARLMFERGQSLFAAMKAKKAAVDALSSVADVAAYDEMAGW